MKLVDEKDREVALRCEVCESNEKWNEHLMCSSCGCYYHPSCLWSTATIANKTSALAKIGWQCPDCKRCQTCKKSDDDTHMLVCDKCDRCFHSYCITGGGSTGLVVRADGTWRCDLCEHEVDLAKTCAGCKCPLISTNPLLNMCGTCLANEKKVAAAAAAVAAATTTATKSQETTPKVRF